LFRPNKFRALTAVFIRTKKRSKYSLPQIKKMSVANKFDERKYQIGEVVKDYGHILSTTTPKLAREPWLSRTGYSS
jgi:hypothetical protein